MATSLVYCDAFITLADTPNRDLIPFYRTLLSCDPHPYQPGRYAEFHPSSGPKLVIFQPQPDQAQKFQAPTSGALSLCWVVADLASAITTLTDLGYPPIQGPIQASHGREIYAADPANNRLIFYQPNISSP